MLGRRFFMAIAEQFMELCRMLSCNSLTSSPSHSSGSRSEKRNNQKQVDNISDITSSEEMGNSSPKTHDLQSCTDQEYVLNILKEENTLKESNFSPYKPLPAIGKSKSERAKPSSRVVRQETYRVHNPVFIKGPFDMQKFPSLKKHLAIEASVVKKTSRAPLADINQGGKRNGKQIITAVNDKSQTLLLKKNEISKIKLKNKFLQSKQIGVNDINNDNKSTFWIEF